MAVSDVVPSDATRARSYQAMALSKFPVFAHALPNASATSPLFGQRGSNDFSRYSRRADWSAVFAFWNSLFTASVCNVSTRANTDGIPASSSDGGGGDGRCASPVPRRYRQSGSP